MMKQSLKTVALAVQLQGNHLVLVLLASAEADQMYYRVTTETDEEFTASPIDQRSL